jgi:GT2 family glycosyltransferase
MAASLSPPICIVIVNWNSWQLLDQCLHALAQQTWQNFKVVVVDNASTLPIPEAFLERPPNIEFMWSDHNLGFAAANNLVIKSKQDVEWFALLNPDAFPEPDWLARLMEATQQHPGYAAFGSRQLIAGSEHLLDGDGDAYHISGLAWRDGHGKVAASANQEVREIFSPCAAAALYRRSVLIKAGGFDEDFFCYVEDVDLGFRLRLMGYRSLLVPGAVVHHIGSATSGGQKSDFSVYHGHRNLVWCYAKNMPGALFWLLLPLHLAMNLAVIVVYTLRGQAHIILKAKKDALYGLPLVWKKRKHIQAGRTAGYAEIWRILRKTFPG